MPNILKTKQADLSVKPSWIRLFTNRDFNLLFFGASISNFGHWMQTTGLGWLVYERTQSKTYLALVPFLAFLPYMILAPFVGPLIDRVNKKRFLIWCEISFMIAAILSTFAVLNRDINPIALLAIAVLTGIISTFESTTRVSSIPSLVTKKDIAVAMPMTFFTFQFGRFIGPFIAGLLIEYVGVSYCFSAGVLTYGILAFCVFLLRADLSSSNKKTQSYIDDFKEGLRFIRDSKELRILFGASFMVYLFGYHIINLLPALVKDILHGDALELGNAGAAAGIGGSLALIFLTLFSEYPIKRYIFTSSIFIIAFVLFYITKATIPMAFNALVALHAFCSTSWGIGLRSTSQMFSPEHLRARILNIDTCVGVGVGITMGPVFGWLAEQSSLQFCFIISSFFVLFTGLGFARNFRRISRVDFIGNETVMAKKTVELVVE